ncbi:YicC/YloC family endoribonuclease [Carnobacterium divergens]|uniref:YicC/YloC family endoribonuclease n=1 Tax=Carnobacterium divergens TaxID=2748 RepID=UPI001EE9AAA8|nr:YicC/YloC family endoribonuclease [Carnobacterium divergens]
MKSMTGFGRHSIHSAAYQIDIEIKSINHRFLEVISRFPKELNAFESEIRKQITATLKRGRVEVYINLKQTAENQKQLQVNWSLIEEAVGFVAEANKKYQAQGIDFTPSLTQLIATGDFLAIEERKIANDDLMNLIQEAMDQALIELVTSRKAEGERLKQHLTNHLFEFEKGVQEVATHTESFEAYYQKRLSTKLMEVAGGFVDEPRLLTELALLLEKADIHEELERLDSHLAQLRVLLEKDTPIGRELDFLIQEMNREVNTIGSKATQIQLTDAVIQMKTQLEKIREQVQNIE